MDQTVEQFRVALEGASNTDTMLDVDLTLHSQTDKEWVVRMAPHFREEDEEDVELKLSKHRDWTPDEIAERCLQELTGYTAYAHLIIG